jgi:hypothetical protein
MNDYNDLRYVAGEDPAMQPCEQCERWKVQSEQIKNILLGVMAYYFNNIYDGAPDGGGISEEIQEACDAYARYCGIKDDSYTIYEFIEYELYKYNKENR